MIREKSAGAVIFRREDKKIKYLLLHYESGHWDFPRGHIERGETEQRAAARETEEETGIKKINFVSGFRVSVSWFYRKKIGKKMLMINKTAALFLAQTKARQIKISDEHIGCKWLVFNKAVEQLTFIQSKKILEKANVFLMEKRGLEFMAVDIF
ncbi:MAG: NUDIX domain-containing protein [Patescibacteria group bacterium]